MKLASDDVPHALVSDDTRAPGPYTVSSGEPRETGLIGRFGSNSTVVFFSQALNNVLAAVFAVVFIRHFGREEYGIFSTVFAYLSFFSVFQSMGVDTIVLREVSRDKRALEQLGSVAALRIALSTASMLASWMLLPSIHPTSRVASLVMLASLSFPLSFYPLYTVPYITELRMMHPNAVFGAWAVIYTGIRLAMVAANLSLESFVIVSLMSDGVTFFAARKLAERAHLRLRIRFDRQLTYRLLSESWPIAFAFISLQLLLRIDQIMLYRMRGALEVGLYAVPVRVVEFANIIPTVFVASAFPLLARLADGLQNDRLAFATRMSFRAMAWVALPLATYTFAFPEACLRVVFGEQFAGASPIMHALAYSPVFSFLNSILFNRLLASGQQKTSAVLAASAAAVNVLLNVPLIALYGGVGAAVATLVAYGSVPLLALFFQDTRALGAMGLQSLLRPSLVAASTLFVIERSSLDPILGGLVLLIVYPLGLILTREIGAVEVRLLLRAFGRGVTAG